jgi:hypothetical protein
MVQLISGAAATRWATNSSPDPRVVWHQYGIPGAAFVTRDTNSSKLLWTFKDSNGALLRTGQIACSTGAPCGQPAVARLARQRDDPLIGRVCVQHRQRPSPVLYGARYPDVPSTARGWTGDGTASASVPPGVQ